eukprot:2343167-Rhodomonas_salina.4
MNPISVQRLGSIRRAGVYGYVYGRAITDARVGMRENGCGYRHMRTAYAYGYGCMGVDAGVCAPYPNPKP